MNRHSFTAATAPGPAAAAGLPDDIRVAYFEPDRAFGTAITGYNAYAALRAEPRVDLFLPAPAMLCVNIDAAPIEVAIGRRRFADVPPVAIYGPTTQPIEVRSGGGVNIGIGIGPIGWARLSRLPADGFRNRVMPLGDAFGAGMAERVHDALATLDDPRRIGETLDAVLRPLLATPHSDEPLIDAVSALLLEEGLGEIGPAAERVGIAAHTLRRLTVRYFGLTPKLLARRARFLRVFLRAVARGGAVSAEVLGRDYYDASHFLRDAQTFLDTTPRRFLARATPILHASLLARAAVLGTPAQALDTGADRPAAA